MSHVSHRFTSKIANKIFFTSLLLIVIVLLIQSFLYIFVIDDAQFFSAIQNLESDLELFQEDIKDKQYDKEYIDLITRDYIRSTGHPLVILNGVLDLDNESFLSMFYNIITLEHEGQQYRVVMTDENIQHVESNTIDVLISPLSENYYYAIFPEEEGYITDEKIITLEDATIIDYQFPDPNLDQSSVYIYQGIDYIENDYKLSSNTLQTFVYDHAEIKANTIFCISHFKKDGQLYYILTSDTIVELRDQLDFITSFNIIILFIGLLMTIIVARVFSKSISKPLVTLRDIANQMAQLDFSKKAVITSHDELGSLANSLNQMSHQLNQNIKALQFKNEELALNYEQKSKEEQRAKDLILHLSHELNTPLGIVSGFNEILSDGINDKEPTYYYEAISHELERMKTLVADMLELSVLESSDYTLSLEPVQISSMIEERLAQYREHFNEKNITVLTTLSDDKVQANPRKIHQVINNFISNAAKYTSEGGTFNIYNTYENGELTFCFENTCVLSEDDPEILWEKFYRTKKTNTRKEKGSGIGLSIAKEILMLHNSDFGINKTESGILIYFNLKLC